MPKLISSYFYFYMVETVGIEPTKKACKASSFPLAYVPIDYRFVFRIKRLQLLTPFQVVMVIMTGPTFYPVFIYSFYNVRAIFRYSLSMG